MTKPISDRMPTEEDANGGKVWVLNGRKWEMWHYENLFSYAGEVRAIPKWLPIEPPPIPEPELLPCPFCGGTEADDEHQIMQCRTCKATGPETLSGESLKHAWNRRAPDARDELIDAIDCSVNSHGLAMTDRDRLDRVRKLIAEYRKGQ